MTKLVNAKLVNANLLWADLDGVIFEDANLSGATFEPKAGRLPDIPMLAEAKNLAGLTYRYRPNGLEMLRMAFRKAGLWRQERQVLYAKKQSELIKACQVDFISTGVLNVAKKMWLCPGEMLSQALFVFTSDWGMAPTRPLILVFLYLLPGMFVVYSIAMALPRYRALGEKMPRAEGVKIQVIWPENGLLGNSWPNKPQPAYEAILPKWPGFLRIVIIGFHFSLLSTFQFGAQLGWRDYNVSAWISRIQPRDYALRATGWIRVVSGMQSIVSFYLIALWALTYFGRPFH